MNLVMTRGMEGVQNPENLAEVNMWFETSWQKSYVHAPLLVGRLPLSFSMLIEKHGWITGYRCRRSQRVWLKCLRSIGVPISV